MGEILSTQKDLNDAIAPLDTRLDTIEANPVLTLVGCDNEVFPANSKLPTCDQMTAADSALEARLAAIEANPVLTATDCNGAVLAENAKLAQCADISSGGGAMDTVAVMVNGDMPLIWGGAYNFAYYGAVPVFALGGGSYSYNPSGEWYSETVVSSGEGRRLPADFTQPGVLCEAKLRLHVGVVYNSSTASLFTPSAQTGDPVHGSIAFRVRVTLFTYYGTPIEWVSPTYSTPAAMPTTAGDYNFIMPSPWVEEYLTSTAGATAYFRPGGHSLEMQVQYMTLGPTPFDIEIQPYLSFTPLYGVATQI